VNFWGGTKGSSALKLLKEYWKLLKTISLL